VHCVHAVGDLLARKTVSLTRIKNRVHENVEDETQDVISTVSVLRSGGVTVFEL
jgi:hypothetical protein